MGSATTASTTPTTTAMAPAPSDCSHMMREGSAQLAGQSTRNCYGTNASLLPSKAIAAHRLSLDRRARKG